jgi:hypothetical protein
MQHSLVTSSRVLVALILAFDRNPAMSRRGAQAYRGQGTRCAIVLNINVDANPDVLASLALGSAINGLILSRGQGTEPDNEYRECRSHNFHITPL